MFHFSACDTRVQGNKKSPPKQLVMAESLLAGHSSNDDDEGEGEELKRGGDHPEKIFFRRLLKRCRPSFGGS